MDGDSKISLNEFANGMKSALTVFDAKKSSRLSSGGAVNRVKPRVPTPKLLKRPLLNRPSV